MLGVSVVKDFFREGISLDTAMSQVTSYAVSDMFYLPPGTIPPMVIPFDPTASVPLCLVSVSSPTMNEKELYDVAYFELRNRLQSIQGVIAPAVYGGKLRRILVYLDRDKLEARGLAPMDVVRARAAFWKVAAPDLDLQVGRSRIGTTTSDLDGRSEWSAALVWSLSWSELGRLRESRARSEAARVRADRTRDQAREEVRQAELSLRAAGLRLDAAHEGLAAATSSVRVQHARFSSGTALLLEVLDAEDGAAAARLRMARSITALHVARIRLRAATGEVLRPPQTASR